MPFRRVKAVGLSTTPDYDSGFLEYEDSEEKVLTHNLDTTKVLVQSFLETTWEQIMPEGYYDQVHIHHLTDTQVTVLNWAPSGSKIRLMMWKSE